MSDARRPRTIEEMVAVMENFRTDESLARGLGLTVRPTDVIISTYSKSGTTWLQHVAHGLRSEGSMEFQEISCVVPWLESAVDIGIDPDADQVWEPRVFKAHLEWGRVPKGGRYITAFRNPKSVLVSFYQFFEGWFFEPGTISLEDFAKHWFLKGTASGSYWDHIVSWHAVVSEPNVLALTYEDMVAQPDRVTAVVAGHMGLEVPEDVLAKVIAQSSRDFMAAHDTKFDEHVLRAMRDELMGLPAGGISTKVAAENRPKPVVSAEIQQQLDDAWAECVTSKIGFESYDAFRSSLPDPLGARI